MLCNEKTNRFGSFFVHLVETIRLVVNEVSVIASECACTDERAPLVTKRSWHTKCAGGATTMFECFCTNKKIKKRTVLVRFFVRLVETIRLELMTSTMST